MRRTVSTAAILATLLAWAAAVVGAPQEAEAHYCAKTGAINFRAADGTRLAGHRFGRGTTAVILAHELRGGACAWLPYARQLAQLGYLTIVFDFRGHGDSQTRTGSAAFRLPADVTAAAKFSRSLGAQKVVLVGASMGGTAVVVAAANARPAVDGVIALSAPSSFGKMNGVAAAQKLQMPILYIAGKDDGGFADEVRTLFDATSSTDKALEILNSGYHGVQLVGYEPTARALVERFIAAR